MFPLNSNGPVPTHPLNLLGLSFQSSLEQHHGRVSCVLFKSLWVQFLTLYLNLMGSLRNVLFFQVTHKINKVNEKHLDALMSFNCTERLPDWCYQSPMGARWSSLLAPVTFPQIPSFTPLCTQFHFCSTDRSLIATTVESHFSTLHLSANFCIFGKWLYHAPDI